MSHACHRFWTCHKTHKTLTFYSLLTPCAIPCACHAKRHFKSSANMLCFSHFDFEMCFARQRRALFDIAIPKVVRSRQCFTRLTSKCASPHNGVHFIDIWTIKSGPSMMCFVHFDFEMCFAPQRRAIFFRHLNFQKCSGPGVLCAFWFRHVLRARTACTFSTSQLSKVLQRWGIFSFFTCKCASHHNGVQLFINHLATWLRTRRFSEPTLRASGATNHWKNTVCRHFPTFSRTWICFLLKLSLFWSLFFFSSLLWLFPSLLFICTYSEVWLLDFLRQADVPLNCPKNYNSFFQNNRPRTTIQLSSMGKQIDLRFSGK